MIDWLQSSIPKEADLLQFSFLLKHFTKHNHTVDDYVRPDRSLHSILFLTYIIMDYCYYFIVLLKQVGFFLTKAVAALHMSFYTSVYKSEHVFRISTWVTLISKTLNLDHYLISEVQRFNLLRGRC